MATAKNGPVTKSAVIHMEFHKDHTKVIQFRPTDGTSIMTAAYVDKSFLGKSVKAIEITIKEV